MKLLRPCLPLALLAAVSTSAIAQTRDVALLDYHGTVPPAWTSRTPSSTSRLAEFVIGKGAADSAEVVVYFFGPQQKPNVDANLARWKGQFSNPDGSPVWQAISRDSSGAFPLTFAEFRGSYQRGIGAGSADSVRAGQQLVSSIVETPHGTMFIQLFGPVARVVAERGTFIGFVKRIK